MGEFSGGDPGIFLALKRMYQNQDTIQGMDVAAMRTGMEGMERMAEIPANKTKWRRYIRKVSSSRSPISSGRSLSGGDTLMYQIPRVS